MSNFIKILEAITEEQLDEAQVTFKKGSELTPAQQKEVKAKYVHRHTGENKPDWAKETWKDGKPYPQHFKDDKDWLENTHFGVTKHGELHKGTKYCNSHPTYPNNPELRKKDIKEGTTFESGLKIKSNSPEDADARFDAYLKKRVATLLKKAKTDDERKMIRKLLENTITEGIVYEDIGYKAIKLFHLKVDSNGRVSTSYGSKTAEGLGQMVVNLVEKG